MNLLINATQKAGIVPQTAPKTNNNTSPVLQPQKPDTFEKQQVEADILME